LINHRLLAIDMSERRAWYQFWKSNEPQRRIASSGRVPTNKSLRVAAGIPDLMRDTERLQKDSNYDNEFDMYDLMLKLDPELNGAVRAVSLTANNYEIQFERGRNAAIRDAIRELVEERLDFDDIMINAMRNMMVYGNDINKIVGRQGDGITDLQNLPIKQITIVDSRGGINSVFDATEDSPITKAEKYLLREMKLNAKEIPASEIMHIKIDYRSNWFVDNRGRKTYGVWGASRFSALKQAIRMKYNSLNNRLSLEDSMTKQYITINKEAIEHIQDPAEQNERLTHIMDEVISLFEGLRGDQIPVLPHYVELHHVDLENSLPESGGFLDAINADIAAVLQVPRVAAGQERGSTFAATFNANLWAVQAISRMHKILEQTCMQMFSLHLDLLDIPHKRVDLPTIRFDAMDSETPLNVMQRATMGYDAGILTLNQSLDMLNLPEVSEGNERKDISPPEPQQENTDLGDVPAENTQPGATDVAPVEED